VRIRDAAKVRSIRHESLCVAGAGLAFLETGARAEARPDDFWSQRTAVAALSDEAAQFIAEAGRDWVGTLSVLNSQAGAVDYLGRPSAGGRALVVAVYVRPSHRGRGLLDSMMDAAADWARDLGVTQLVLDVHELNAPARRAYVRLGFTATGRVSEGANGRELELLRRL
jgi:GNAT superfamily N-acetyltransferase